MKPMPPMSMAEATETTTSRRHGSQTYTCAKCPYWSPNFCSITARFQVGGALACRYGRVKIGSALQRKRKAKSCAS